HVVRPGELGESERAAWRACQLSDDTLASPFLSPEFALAVDAARRDARVAVVEGLGGGAPAFLAFSVDANGDRAPVGATIWDAQGFVAPPAVDWDARALIGACGMRSWGFDHLVSTQRPFVPFHHALHASPVADLTAGHDAYLRAVRDRSKDVLAQTGRRRRK